MNDMQERIVSLLREAAEALRKINLPETLAAQIERRIEEVGRPCVVAVLGQVKAGKSTFINAFLGLDLAKVGTTETTATINYFCYGKHDSRFPVRVRCFWRGGQSEYVDLTFVDSLQGNDIETLRRADGIDRLEYYLERDYLEQVTLVDTPGIGAVVTKHQERTADFLHLEGQLRHRHHEEIFKDRTEDFTHLEKQLRHRHHEETQHIGSGADAVIYVMDSTARETDRAFLEEFRRVTQGQTQAFNAIAVMAKIDMHSEKIDRRSELAAKIAHQLKEQLNTVIPISAGIRRALDRLLENDEAGLKQLIETIRHIPPDLRDTLLTSDALFLDPELDPATYEERKALLDDMPWTVFTTIAHQAADETRDSENIKHALNDLAGFDQLRDVLEQHFFKRSHILRCHHILRDVRKILGEIRRTHLRDIRIQERKEKGFLTFIQQARENNPEVARELEIFIKARLAGQSSKVEALLDELERKVAIMYHEIDQHNADFEALHEIQKHKDLFLDAELEELQPLLGLYGLELEKRLPPGQKSKSYVSERYTYWRRQEREASSPVVREVAQKVMSRYSYILKEVSMPGRIEKV